MAPRRRLSCRSLETRNTATQQGTQPSDNQQQPNGQIVMYQALYQSIGDEEWTDTHGKSEQEVSQEHGGEESRFECGWVRRGGLETSRREDFFSGKEDKVQAPERRSALRESLLSIWKVDIYQAL